MYDTVCECVSVVYCVNVIAVRVRVPIGDNKCTLGQPKLIWLNKQDSEL